ncbi:MAG: HAD family hydrolase [Candidatus Rokubacteria bacterium]|nr:HAD family hydrolase [Candidatus Rokubacteria bacterium]
MIRAILFDAGNTLIHMDYVAIAAELARHGVAVTPEQIQRGDWTARVRLDGELFAPQDAVSTESRDTTARYTRYLLEGAGVHDPALHERMMAWRRGYNAPVGLWTVAEPEAADALALVRQAGRVAGVISNSNGTIRRILESLDLARRLDFILDSHEEGLEKPDARFFQLALARAGVAPDEAAYIGDFYSIDVMGARRAGIRGVLMDPGGCWGVRDCPCAPTVLDAVRLVLRWGTQGAPQSPRAEGPA